MQLSGSLALILALAYCLAATVPLAAQRPGGTVPADPVASAKDFLLLFLAKDPKLPAAFNEAMKKAFSAAQAGELADQLAGKSGAWSNFGEARTEAKAGFTVVTVKGNYERLSLDFRVTFDEGGRIAGFFIQNLVVKGGGWKLPPYANSSSFREEGVIVDAGGWPLEGTLSLPRSGVLLPAVVLVQGSGPSDRDESIGPNKVFGDLASGLASRGIAVLRYEKRTLTYGAKLAESSASLGIREETIDDAVAALILLAKDRRIDGNRIFLMGHSLGAMLAPMIAEEARKKGLSLAGLVLIAPNARPLEDLIYDQLRYLAKVAGSFTVEETASIEKLRAAVTKVKGLSPTAGPADPGADELPLGIPAAYWRSLAGYDPVARAAKLGLPILVIHGERDYQVMSGEARLWQEGLAGRKNARTYLLPGLNHLMMRGQGPSLPAEYEQPGHVDEAVLNLATPFIGRK